MKSPGQRWSPLPAELTRAEREFFLELRRLIDIAGLTYRALEQSSLAAAATAGNYCYSKSQWGRWLNAQSIPPRNAVRQLTAILAAENVAAEHLLELWSRTFTPASPAEAGQDDGGLKVQEALVGRDAEMTLLTGLIGQAAGGRGSCVLIEGEPGIGKSALARAAVTVAREAGCEVFWGSGDELAQALPLLPFIDGLRVRNPSADPRRNTIVRLLRGEALLDRGADAQALLIEQLLALVAEQCAVRPTVLLIDDLQWADTASVAVWGRLARSARQMPLLLIGMMRPVPQREDLRALRRVAGKARLQLTALTETAVCELVAALAGGTPDAGLRKLADGAGGNPLYLIELVAALARGGRLTITAGGTAGLAGGSVPGSLPAAIADRLDFVGRPSRAVLRAAALLGVDFAVRELAAVAGRDVADLVPALEEACAAGILTESGGGFGFRHPLIRTALYDEMPAPVRIAWHRDAGKALAAAGAPIDRVARQMLLAADGPGGTTERLDEWMLDWLGRSADPLVSQAPSVAVQLLAWAVASCPAESARHDWLASRLADACYRTGDRTRAAQVVESALEHATEPGLLVDLHWTLAQCRMQAGRSAEALAALDGALASPGISARHRARLLVLAARVHSSRGEDGMAGQLASGALETAAPAGDTWAMAWALHVLTIVTVARGQMTDALPLFDRALSVTNGDPALSDLRMLLQLNKAVLLGVLDQHEQAFAAARQVRDLAAQGGTAVRLAQAHSALGQLLFGTGQWDDALTEVAALPATLKEPGVACCDLGIAAVISLHRGEIKAARRHLEAAVPYAKRCEPRLIAALTLARSLDFEHAGALPEALGVLTRAIEADPDEHEMEELLADAARLAARTGDLGTARTLTARAAALAAGSGVPHRQGNELYCRSLLGHDGTGLLTAAGHYQDASRPLPSAKALEAAAGEFARAGDRGQARAAAAGAVDAYTSLGATADIARLRERFRTA